MRGTGLENEGKENERKTWMENAGNGNCREWIMRGNQYGKCREWKLQGKENAGRKMKGRKMTGNPIWKMQGMEIARKRKCRELRAENEGKENDRKPYMENAGNGSCREWKMRGID